MAWLTANALFIGALLIGLPYAVGDFWAYTLALYFLYAVACLGIGLSWGQAGLLSLGQGFFVGIGAYLSGLSLIAHADSVLLYPLLIASAVLPGLLAYGIGRLIFHGRAQNGAYFALITLALVLLAAQIATSWNAVTGGYNGLRNIPGIPGFDGFEDAYTLSAVALFLCMLFVGWMIASPLGVLWRAISQNERRVAFLGFDHNQLKAVAFGFSGLLGGIAGMLYAPENNLVTPDLFGFVLSTNFVVWVAIGGRATLYGPVVGAIALGLLTATLRESISYWEVILAVLFIATVLYFRHGLFGQVEPFLKRRLDPDSRSVVPAPERQKPAGHALMQLQGLNLRAGSVQILDDLSLNMDRPGIYCMIGPNGAGKTSTFNAVTGELQFQSGTVQVLGETQAKPDPRQLTKSGLGRKFQIPNVFENLTVGENIAMALWTGRAGWRDLVSLSPLRWTSPVLQDLEQRFDFLQQRDRIVSDLSHGQRQVLDLAMVLCTEPRLILLDEPCAGLSLAETEQVIETIRWATDRFVATTLVIEHDMALVETLADHVFVLHNGHLLAEGSVKDIQSNAEVQSVYSGGTK